MNRKKRYIKKYDQFIIAVQLNLETNGFTFWKWGGLQQCKRGDWIADNNGETYTIDQESFAKTYRRTGPGTYVKITPVWAIQADQPGAVKTKEGETKYNRGDYIVSDSENGTDTYAVSKDNFELMYQIDEENVP